MTAITSILPTPAGRRLLAACCFAIALLGCGDSSSEAARAGSSPNVNTGGGSGNFGDGAAPGEPTGSGGGGGAEGPSEPEPDPVLPEVEEELVYGRPEAAQNVVFLLNSERGRVIIVDARTLAVRSAAVGADPREARALGGRDEALVLNVGSSAVSWVLASGGEPEIATVGVVEGSNRLTVSPLGDAAIAWYDAARAQPGDPAGSFQEVSLLRLTDDGAIESVRAAVGFRPVAVQFRADGAVAFVVTEQGVSALDVDDERETLVGPPIPVSEDPFEAVTEREVRITPDGRFAVVRVLGQSEARVLRLDDTAELVSVALPGEPTDLDMLPDGDRALLVLRESSLAVILDVAAAAADPADAGALSTIDLAPARPGLATVTPDGGRAVLYTTLGAEEEVTILDLARSRARRVPLKKTVRGVAAAPDGRSALLLHGPSDGGAEDPVEASIDAAEGYSVLQLATGFARLELTEGAPGSFTFDEGGGALYLLEPQTPTGAHLLHTVDLRTTVGGRATLASRPLDVQWVPAARKLAVSQEHPSGRITFVDPSDDSTRTLTGFELNGLVD